MEIKNKKTIDSSQAAVLIILLNIIAIALFLLITKELENLAKAITLGIISIVINFLLAKYLFIKKFEIASNTPTIKKHFFISFIIIVILFAIYGFTDFNRVKTSAHIIMLPTYNYSEEIKNMLYEDAKYPLSFSPVPLFNTREATVDDVEKIKEDIVEQEKDIDSQLEKLKNSWIITILTYSITSLIGIVLLSLNTENLLVKEEKAEYSNE